MLHSSVSSGHYTEQTWYSYRNVDDGSLYLFPVRILWKLENCGVDSLS